jgi:succinate-acetate transporter protein
MATSGTIGQEAGPARQAPSPVPAGMANPAPWAVTAFGTTSFMLGMYQTHLLNNAESTFGRKVLPFGPPPLR